MKIVKKVFFIALMIWFVYTVTVNARTAKINTEGARMRREPNTTSDVLTVVYEQETVEIIEKENDWYKVKYGEYEGYIREDLMDVDEENNSEIQPNNEEQNSNTSEEEQQSNEEQNSNTQSEENKEPENATTDVFEQGEKTVKTNTYAKVIPSFSSSSIMELKLGQKVLAKKQMNKWYCIEVDGKLAWVPTSVLTDEGETTPVQEPEEPEKPEEADTPEENLPSKMYINVSAAVLRSGPSTSSDPIAEMYMGRSVEILGEDGDWYKVKYEDQEGYVAKRLVSDTASGTHRSLMEERSIDDVQNPNGEPLEIEEAQDNKISEAQNANNVVENSQDTNNETNNKKEEQLAVIKTVYVNTAVANLREGPSTATPKVGTAKSKDALEVVGEEKGWYKIKNGEGFAYILGSLTVNSLDEIQGKVVEQTTPQTDTATNTGEAVVSYAKEFLGHPYVYGGAGPSSFDCSGFTKYVYGHFGISLSHSATAQANNGTYVEKQALQLGDLVIFRDWDNASIGHCGIYIGGGRFIHAANPTRGVVTDTLNSGYYYERYVSGRRLF